MKYTDMQPGDMLEAVGDDAQKWADAFAELFPAMDRETMVGWFANAIEHSSDVRFWRLAKSDEAMADHIENLGRARRSLRNVDLMTDVEPVTMTGED